jgi:hypothetical protein
MKYLFLLLFGFSSLYGKSEGRLLLYGNCITCHHETKSISAPSLKIIKTRYHEAFRDKETFVNYMVEWISSPNLKGSIMHDMVKKYQLMPELGYDKDTLEKIARYIYYMER